VIKELAAERFREFFRELHGNDPFPWQERLAKQVCAAGWPRVLDLPTASGKTACIDIAVFAMAFRLSGPRRVFFVVDRRVVVDAAFDRMERIVKAVSSATGGTLRQVAERLKRLSDTDKPLDAFQMRGGIYRDDSWVRSPLQPVLIASTVDQVGSRLLFRGYGVSESRWPVDAALVANDSLILLDEAHCSEPFAATVRAIAGKYRRWGKQVGGPLEFVSMTATPSSENGDTFQLADDDYTAMRQRLFAPKKIELRASKARAKDYRKLAQDLVHEALRLAKEPGIRRIAVMVNRVRMAKLVWEILKEGGCRAHLLIGRMRPVDRATLPQEVQAMASGRPRTPDEEPGFIVSTQCLEVGADLDFDAIVTECAGVDALQQRFGRLDRLGDLHGSGAQASGTVMIAEPMADLKYHDPVYAGALAKTWNWLGGADAKVDFGICSESGKETVREHLRALGQDGNELRTEWPIYPMLLPSHLDSLVQTSPRPAAEPDVSLFLHGKQHGSADVQVVWRVDLDLNHTDTWAEVVALCPPVSGEAMAVPVWEFRSWLAGQTEGTGTGSDLEGAEPGEANAKGDPRFPVLRWCGDESTLVRRAEDVRPGDTLVLSAAGGGWNELGHVPEDASTDRAEEARAALRRNWVVRLHPAVLQSWPESEGKEALVTAAGDSEGYPLSPLRTYCAGLAPGWLREYLERVPRRIRIEPYPSESEEHGGWVLSGRYAQADSGQDEGSALEPIPLNAHLSDVTGVVRQLAEAAIFDADLRSSLVQAAERHDAGKADLRFQALLHGGDPLAARFAPKLLAKGVLAGQSPSARKAQWVRSGLPENFRHELVSLLLAHSDCADELALHLIATHHGRCRPFAPVVRDTGGELKYEGRCVTAQERLQHAPHRLGAGVADRFWRLIREYGWWGLAYLEALLRLGDWKASEMEAKRKEKSDYAAAGH
jgi:CRISPR-associated endonuclease/helicase Cas3